MHRRLAGFLAVAVAFGAVGTALADISVSFAPATQDVDILSGTTTVDIVADIPQADAMVAWGLDLSLTGSSVSLADIMINELAFDEVTGADADGLAAIVPLDSLFGDDIVLATLTFSLDDLGLTTLSLSATGGDLTEGFALDPEVGGFASVNYFDGEINVTPEPASALLVAFAALALRRRC